MNPVKVIALADIHQSLEKWIQLTAVVRENKPDFVFIAGDIFPKEEGILNQANYLPLLKQNAAEIKQAGAELVLIPGNDDNRLLVPEIEKADQDGLFHCVADRVKRIRGFEICGCPWIKDYPFGYKHWVAPESPEEKAISPVQFGPTLTISDSNEVEPIPDFEAYLENKLSIEESLEQMAEQVKNLANSIWLIHEPPSDLNLDLCATGDRVGSRLVYDFLLDKQPLLSIHGHIHEAPKYNGGIWSAKIGDTTCLQPGQTDETLCYVSLRIYNGRIENMAHSVF